MSHDPYLEPPPGDVPPTKPILSEAPAGGAGWIALAAVAAVLVIAAYFYLRPDMPAPAMRADAPPAATPPRN